MLRPARVTDLPVLLELIGEYYAFDGLEYDPVVVGRGLEQLLGHPEYGQAFLIETGGPVAGYCILTYAFDLEFGGRQGFLTDLYLRPGHRGRGLGRESLEGLERFARDQGLRSLELQVESHNPAAQHFYQKLGFRVHARVPMSKML